MAALGTLPSNPTTADWVLLATFNENLIDKEWKLAGDRAALMATTQAFLFGAFFLVLFNKTANPDAAKLLLNTIPIVGATIIVFASCGIYAAVKVARRLELERSFYQTVLSSIFGFVIPDLGARRDGGFTLAWSRVLGTVPFVVVTVILFVLWGIVLLSRLPFLLDIKAVD